MDLADNDALTGEKISHAIYHRCQLQTAKQYFRSRTTQITHQFGFCFSPETAKAYKELGDAALAKEEYQNALSFYTEGINVKCKDDQLNVELYQCRWLSNCHLGKFSL